jgi:Rad3-related DNA helicase
LYFLDVRAFLCTTKLYIHLDVLLERFSLGSRYKDDLANENVRESSLCEIIISATVFYLELYSNHKQRVASFDWTPIIKLLFKSPYSLFLFVILKQLEYPKNSVGDFLTSLKKYLAEWEKTLEKTSNKVYFNFPTKKYLRRVFNLVLDDNLLKKLVVFQEPDQNLTSIDLKSIILYLETLIKIYPTRYF